MAAKSKSKTKPVKRANPTTSAARKSRVSKPKSAKPVARKNGKSRPKKTPSRTPSKVPKVELRVAPRSGGNGQPKAPLGQKPTVRSREYSSAIHAYESGLKLMHAENYERAIKAFGELIVDHSGEAEILERARVLMHACENKLHERGKAVLKSADDHYNLGIAELNRRELEAAAQHLQQALKLAPKGDHILYAMAALNALKGNRDEALTFLKQAIHHRAENRFLASRDSDFENLAADSDFRQLVTSSE
jgi:tetratricopeptide (TPR) repeat protein